MSFRFFFQSLKLCKIKRKILQFEHQVKIEKCGGWSKKKTLEKKILTDRQLWKVKLDSDILASHRPKSLNYDLCLVPKIYSK